MIPPYIIIDPEIDGRNFEILNNNRVFCVPYEYRHSDCTSK